MIRLLYGTSNLAKIKHMKEMLKGVDIEIISLRDIGNPDIASINEIGNDPLENAKIKAMAYYRELKIPVFSCDSELYIEGLENERQPGVHVRRVNGKELNDDEMIEYYTNLVTELGGVVKAKYKNAICLIIDEKNIFEYDGEDIASEEFIITSKPHIKRINGFPLDSISIEIETGQYYLEINKDNNFETEYKMAEGFKNFFVENVKLK
ncbi:non-canonical purine NTP pyrophosphatase [Proteiniborus sp. MB09-C3]|uniref:non-canonical purine NTP pyrophosphatase n=1 Tax=Proteiniborus sp. MB09-C3 TaxID=3050072 RepID=UPI002554965C|nr:non-canonical purine NTP pyrophosphatase [Proteiniborus sp. MB09-C3]WIV11578.1 non-canonical purine NTP pyrophosphatase [Proteiniborus sp. MB09-C3]